MTRELSEYEKGLHQEINEAADILAEALGYTHDEEYGWVTGDHTVITLAMEVRTRGVKPKPTTPEEINEAFDNLELIKERWSRLTRGDDA